MTAPTPPSEPSSLGQFKGFVPHEDLLSCIHCGLCTSSCPTYLETGNENDSPRGRIHLMRGVEEQRIELTDKVRGHLDLCLDCRSCETACPSGVQYGQLIETFRHSDVAENKSPGKHAWFQKYILRDLLTDRRRMERLLWPARLMQWLKLDRLLEWTGLVRLLPMPLQRMHRMLPKLRKYQPQLPDRLSREPDTVAPVTATRKVGLFLGCVGDGMFRHLHWATARVLQKAGCDVVVPHTQQCCGAMEFHSGQVQSAIDRAQENIAAFREQSVEAIIVNVAGCGAMLKEYTHLAKHDPEHTQELNQFAGKVQDVNEFLTTIELPDPTGSMPITVVYQDACHLRHAQQIEKQPRVLLSRIPDLTILPIPEPNICCGAAGSYNLLQPEMSDQLGERKIGHILKQNPDAIVTANAGCALQLQALLKERGKKIPVVHPIELLDASLQNKSWTEFCEENDL